VRAAELDIQAEHADSGEALRLRDVLRFAVQSTLAVRRKQAATKLHSEFQTLEL